MRNLILKAALLFMSFTLLFSPLHPEAKGKSDPPRPCMDEASVQLQSAFRKLWIDHTIWTKSYIVSAISDLDDQEKVLTRLLKNQDDIGNAIKPFYGEDAGNKLAQLLREHIQLAGKVVEAAKSGNQATYKKYNAEWYKNADDIALFLSKANPNWSQEELKDLLYTHLQLLTDQVSARLKKDTEAEIIAFDKGEDHIIKLADVLTKGIIKQFPKKF
ncbi:glycosyltransferase [Peribacillus sp. NPDC097675]|uniref:glycosyltransferase n=1 Tax=Peribacillus sp. NPDC097675 TaxID=3390618 RepID=UPI003D0420B6